MSEEVRKVKRPDRNARKTKLNLVSRQTHSVSSAGNALFRSGELKVMSMQVRDKLLTL
jgi:hypothetical protein